MKSFLSALIVMLFSSTAQALDYQVEFKSEPTPRPTSSTKRPNQLPDGETLQGNGAYAEAWLSHPTTRYAHGVLGDAVEAGGMTVMLWDNRQNQLLLPKDSVFEDRLLRPIELGGQLGSAFLVVRSYLDRGAALALIALVGGQPAIVAETPPIGLPHRWLNPVGTGDFDGDGQLDVAVVVTPHIGGTLTVYGFDGKDFHPKYTVSGFSNHAHGSRELGLSAVGDVDGDGTPELFIPDGSRRHIRIVSFKGGHFHELARLENLPPLHGAFAFTPAIRQQKARLTYRSKSGMRAYITFTP